MAFALESDSEFKQHEKVTAVSAAEPTDKAAGARGAQSKRGQNMAGSSAGSA